MKPTIWNAFTRTRRGRAPGSKPARSFAPMKASIENMPFGWTLKLDPMQAVDAVRLWADISSPASSATLVLNLEQSVWSAESRPLPVGRIVRRLGLETLAVIDDEAILVADVPLRQLLSLLETSMVRLVRIDGPVEPADVQAIRGALAQGRSALEADVRVVAAMEVRNDRSVTLQTRTIEPALQLIGHNLRHYLAALLSRPAESFDSPPAWQIKRLLEVSGHMIIRPIETQVLSTSVDIGINTDPPGPSKPATRCLVYDRPSGTWHDEA